MLPQESPRLGHIAAVFNSVYFWSALCLMCAAIYAWANRHSINTDGLSYLDIASEVLKSGPSNLVNGYWSPLYPTVIALTFSIIRPSPSGEFPTIQLANFFVFC